MRVLVCLNIVYSFKQFVGNGGGMSLNIINIVEIKENLACLLKLSDLEGWLLETCV